MIFFFFRPVLHNSLVVELRLKLELCPDLRFSTLIAQGLFIHITLVVNSCLAIIRCVKLTDLVAAGKNTGSVHVE